MSNVLGVLPVYGGNGSLLGYRLQTYPNMKTVLVFEDQGYMEGFRMGDKFIAGFDEVLSYGDPVFFDSTGSNSAASKGE